MALSGEVVFHARVLTKIYWQGDVKVHALRGVDIDMLDGEFILQAVSGCAAGARLCRFPVRGRVRRVPRDR